MTGNFGITLPVMLAAGIAVAVSKRLTYGSIYTTKLLRRGIDIERAKPGDVLSRLRVSDAMLPVPGANGTPGVGLPAGPSSLEAPSEPSVAAGGTISDAGRAQVLFGDETLEQALRQLALHGTIGLPVVSHDGERLLGWLTRQIVLHTLADSVDASWREFRRGAEAADLGYRNPRAVARTPGSPLDGYRIVELTISGDSPVIGQRTNKWPGPRVRSSSPPDRAGTSWRPDRTHELRPGDQLIMITANRGSDADPQAPAQRAPGLR